MVVSPRNTRRALQKAVLDKTLILCYCPLQHSCSFVLKYVFFSCSNRPLELVPDKTFNFCDCLKEKKIHECNYLHSYILHIFWWVTMESCCVRHAAEAACWVERESLQHVVHKTCSNTHVAKEGGQRYVLRKAALVRRQDR